MEKDQNRVAKRLLRFMHEQFAQRQRLEEPSHHADAAEFVDYLEDASGARTEEDAAGTVPWSLRVAAAWSWRTLLVIAAVALLLYALSYLMVVVVPVLVAALLAVLLEPLLRIQLRLKVPRVLAAVISLLVGIGVVFGLLYLATSQIVADVTSVVARAQEGAQQVVQWLSGPPLNIDTTQASQALGEIQQHIASFLQEHASSLATNAVATASSLASLFTGLLTALFCLFFFLKDGRRIWQWFLRLCPRETRNQLNEAAIRGWVTLGSYVRTQMLVAAIDAVGIGFGAFFLGVPFAVPIGVLVFLASFVPIVGAVLSGFIAVAVALVNSGVQTAVIMLIIILVVQQIESNLLHPALMSNAVNMHPVAVLLSVSAGGFIAGIPGAVFTVPVVAFINTVVLYLKGYDNFLYLNYQHDRPGGPPGSLDKQMAEASRPSKANIEHARKAKRKAMAEGYLISVREQVSEAATIKEEVAQSLSEFRVDDATQLSPENPDINPDGTQPAHYGDPQDLLKEKDEGEASSSGDSRR